MGVRKIPVGDVSVVNKAMQLPVITGRKRLGGNEMNLEIFCSYSRI